MERNTGKKRRADDFLCGRWPLPDYEVPKVIRADLPKTCRDKNQEFTAPESGQIIRICCKTFCKVKLHPIWVYGRLLPILGAAARRALRPRRHFQETASTDRGNFS